MNLRATFAFALLTAGLPAPCAGQSARPAGALPRERVRLGIEVLISDSVHLIRGKRVGLITNHTGVLPDGRSTIDVLARTPGVKLTALFAPEHGIRGAAPDGEKIPTMVDSATGVTIHSLYGETRVPTPEMMKDVDILLYDIQDVGSRTYTYQWTLALSAEAVKKKVIVLDRPNPVRGDRVEGGALDPKYASFVGRYPVAVRYGLTVGELARYLVETGQVQADITVVPMVGWRRDMWWSDTGLPWRNPSPNIRSPDAALLYTGTVYFEGTNLSEGRGTPMPFQLIGAPWLNDAKEIARELNAKRIPGVVFDSTLITVEPTAFKHGGLRIPMIAIAVSDRDAVRPQEVALHLMRAIYKRHPNDFKWRESINRLSGSERLRQAVEREGGIEELLPIWEQESREFAKKIESYLIYR